MLFDFLFIIYLFFCCLDILTDCAFPLFGRTQTNLWRLSIRTKCERVLQAPAARVAHRRSRADVHPALANTYPRIERRLRLSADSSAT